DDVRRRQLAHRRLASRGHEVVLRLLDRHPGLERLEVMHQELGVERVGMIEVHLAALVEREVLEVFVVAVLIDQDHARLGHGFMWYSSTAQPLRWNLSSSLVSVCGVRCPEMSASHCSSLGNDVSSSSALSPAVLFSTCQSFVVGPVSPLIAIVVC